MTIIETPRGDAPLSTPARVGSPVTMQAPGGLSAATPGPFSLFDAIRLSASDNLAGASAPALSFQTEGGAP